MIHKLKELLLAGFALPLLACSTAPAVTVCISDPSQSGMECSSPYQGDYYLPYRLSENYVCMSDYDAEILFEYIRRRD